MIISEYVRLKVKIILSNNQFKQKLFAYRKTGAGTLQKPENGDSRGTLQKPENRDPSGTLQNRKPGP